MYFLSIMLPPPPREPGAIGPGEPDKKRRPDRLVQSIWPLPVRRYLRP
jgi:hypothetical protein